MNELPETLSLLYFDRSDITLCSWYVRLAMNSMSGSLKQLLNSHCFSDR